MTDTTKMANSNATEGGTFVPMSEAQMEAAKGGELFDIEAFHHWVVDLIDEQASDPNSIVAQVLGNLAPPPTLNEGFWMEVSDGLDEQGVEVPPWDLLDPFGW